MDIPKHIQVKMHTAAKKFKEAHALMEEIDEWIDKHVESELREAGETEPWRSGNGVSLEELEYGNDVTDQFVEWAKQGFDILE